MSIELDVAWSGWIWVENFLQVTYTFELACRIKRQGCLFFANVETMVWNYLDFLMVCGGVLDLWFVPLIDWVEESFLDMDTTTHSSTLSGFLKILKIMRILRVLRLVRLLKMVHPLYKLLIGVIVS